MSAPPPPTPNSSPDPKFQTCKATEGHSALLGPAYSPTPAWLRPALRAFHAGTATEADLQLLRWAKAKFAAEAAAALRPKMTPK